MEREHISELFSLQIDPVTKSYLFETARWARFLSIVGFVLCVLIILGGLLFGSVFSYFINAYDTNGLNPTGLGVTMAIVYILVSVLYFFPCLFLFRFATKMKIALNGNAQEELNLSFQNLKSLFKYVGIITIIVLALYGLAFVIGILGLATR
jgi:Family of unknown function (DUF5362)